MTRYLYPDDVENNFITKLGPKLGPVYNALYNECAWLVLKWQQYRELFGTNSERIDMLNQSAPLFFGIVDDVLFNDILLELTAFTDPPKSAGKDNLTICLLPDLVASGDFQRELNEMVDTACEATKFARDWRNRNIAHHDFAQALDKEVKPLTPVTRQMIDNAIQAICDVIQKISIYYLHSQITFEPKPIIGGVIGLLYTLREGIEMQSARHERLQSGKPEPKDIEPTRDI
jgi:hypothetical protein